MEIVLVVAMAENNVIGHNGKIPWKLSEDLKHFKELTMGCPIIMGRKTYESLPASVRPLPGRTNIIISRNLKDATGVNIFSDVGRALTFAKDDAKTLGRDKVFVIGGAEIYKLFLPMANRLEVTHISGKFEGDVRFPDFKHEWKEKKREDKVSEDGLKYSFVSYSR